MSENGVGGNVNKPGHLFQGVQSWSPSGKAAGTKGSSVSVTASEIQRELIRARHWRLIVIRN